MAASPPRIEIADARRLALRAQGLLTTPPRRRKAERPGPDAVAAVVEQIGCLQLDPVAPVARSPLLVLHARLGPFPDDALDLAAYRDRALLDAWAHEASLVHVADLDLHVHATTTHLDEVRPWVQKAAEFLRENESWVGELLADIGERGPVRATELQDGSNAAWRHGWWTDEISPQQTVARMLHTLWRTGRIGVYDRDTGGGRRWHLLERCLPDGALAGVTPLTREQFTDRAALRSLGMLGVATAPQIRAHFLRRTYHELPQSLARLEGSGAITRVRIGDLKGTWWARTEDLDAELPEPERLVALSPFDNLVCDRARAAELFGFDHRLEIYVPPAKRRWGYYVMPILRADRFIGRADLKHDRATGELRILALHREPGTRGESALRRAITDLGRWRGTTAVTGP